MFGLSKKDNEKKVKQPKKKKVKKVKEKKPKLPHKHFSILEIVSILAVVGAAGTMAFIFVKNHSKKPVPETDKELINQLNLSLSNNFKNAKHIDLTEAIDKIEGNGINFTKYKFSNNLTELIFDDSKNLFGLYEKGSGVTYPDDIVRKEEEINTSLWRFTNTNPTDRTYHFSYYLLDDCAGKITCVGGIDVGRNDDITDIIYINNTSEKQPVTFKTNSYETEINVSERVGDTINHYGKLGKLTVTRLHTDSYHEYGDLKYAYVTSGRVVAEDGGNIDVAYVTSEVAFLQTKGSGSIQEPYASTYRVRNASQKKDDTHGNKLPLIYNDDLSQEDNENIAITSGEYALNIAIVNERIEKGYEKHPNAVAYIREGDTITVFDSVSEAVDFFSDSREGTINVTGSDNTGLPIRIKDQNLVIRGGNNTKPSISSNIDIAHTSGFHNIKFENISFGGNIVDHSICSNKNNVNLLEFDNCLFSSGSDETYSAMITLCPGDEYIGTQLTVKNSEFNLSNKTGITTRGIYDANDSENRGESVYSLDGVQHQIYDNVFKGLVVSNNPAIVTNFARVFNNRFENFRFAFSLIPTKLPENAVQFDVNISNNTFSNIKFLFKLFDVNECFELDDFRFDFGGSNSNSFSSVENIGYFDVATTDAYVESRFGEWNSKSWNGITNRYIGITLDSITMNLESSTVLGAHTLSNGERIRTYSESAYESERHGYTIKDDEGNKYYFYSRFNDEIIVFLKEDTGEAYLSLLGSGDVESLKVKETPTNIDWLDKDIFKDEETYNELKYYDYESGDKVGALYKIDEQFSTLDGNTFVNCELIQNEKFLRVNHLPEPTPEEPEIPEEPESLKVSKLPDDPEQSETPEDPVDPETPEIPVDPETSEDPETPEVPETPEEPEEVVVKKGLEVYISDIGERTKLVLTNDENPFVSDSDALTQFVVSVPNDAKVVLSGRYDVELQGTIENLVLRDRLNVKFASGSSVSKLCEISGENAENLKLENNGAIEKLVVNSKANITNNSLIKNLVTGEVGSKHIEETLQVTSGAFIYNKGNILNFVTYAKTEVLNNINGYIDELKVTFVEGYRGLSVGSYITNNGTMCTGEGNIYLYTECKLFNYGVIGLEGRSTVGGLIVIGDHGESDSHDGVVINNVTGIIWAGKALEDESLVTRTFVIYGVTKGKGEIHPEVSITSDGVIAGTSTDEEKVLIVELDISPNVILEIKI